ncbi:MAG: DctP family TRAP transporter solute-binding subunit [Elusimicrobiota bacterium]|jgi:tripartite ATP-independent transporter DctP family solute receptor|nr:DctP family TRAP transporter solute-binding subunit [Elusimicrobiota bacterium]
MRKFYKAAVLGIMTAFMAGLLFVGQSQAITKSGNKTIIRVGNETGKTDSQFIGLQVMAAEVKKLSKGSMELQLNPGSVLGSGPAMVDMVKNGTLDIYMGGAGFFAAWDGRLFVFDIPYLFSSAEQAHAILDSDFGAEMLSTLEPFGVKGLAFWENGVRNITNSVRPIKTPDDVKGLKLRVMPANPVHVKIWTMMGAKPEPLTFSAIYDALKNKTVDGQEHPISAIYSGKFYEVQKYMSLTRHIYGPLIMIMNKASFDSLTKEQQDIMITASKAGAAAQRKFIKDNEAKFSAEMQKAGMEIIEVDPAPFRNKVRPTIEKDYIKQNGNAWLKKIESLKK